MTFDSMIPRLFRVTRRLRETHDTFTLELEAPEGRFECRPGQSNMLYAFGVGEAPISVSRLVEESGRLLHTIRVVGPVTQALGELREGDSLGVRGPFGVGWPVEECAGGDVLLVAGGIGLAPLRPALDRILERRAEYGHVALIYGARTPEDILYARELERWRSRLDLDVQVTVDRASGEWRGNVGVVTTLLGRVPFRPEKTSVMVCGPEMMMSASARELHKRGVDFGRLYVSMERNMKCALGFCGHCQFGPSFVCKDGPVFRYDRVEALMMVHEV